MKRAPIVLTGTALGLVAVVGYHAATPQTSSLTAASAATPAAAGATTTRAASSTSGGTSGGTSGSTSTGTSSATRSATGTDVSYQFGDLQVKVTMTGTRITDVSLVRADVFDSRSQAIDQYALPQLRSEALSAQSARIDGVSGASYTSQAYAQSLQSAIDKLKA